MEALLSRAKKVSEAVEVYQVVTETTPVQFEANRLKKIETKESNWVAVRLINKGRIGYATATSLADAEKLVDHALETARFGQEARFVFPRVSQYPGVEVFDPRVAAVPLEAMIELGKSLVSRVTEHTPEVLCSAGVTKFTSRVRILNSLGGEAEYKLSAMSAGLEGTLIRGSDMLFVGDLATSCHPVNEADSIIQTVTRQLEWARNQISLPTQPMPVIFTPFGVASALIAPLASAFNGKTVLQGASPLGKRLGELVFDTRLNLYDDATIPFRPGSRPCDDEAVPSRRTPLIEGGRVMGFLYDLATAALAKTESTGNGERSQGGQVNPAQSALWISPGENSFAAMIESVDEGLVIEHLMGATQGNILGGDFSGNVLLGYKIEKGKIVGRVKDTMVFGNIYELLKENLALGSDGRWVDGLFTPSIYCPKISVAGK